MMVGYFAAAILVIGLAAFGYRFERLKSAPASGAAPATGAASPFPDNPLLDTTMLREAAPANGAHAGALDLQTVDAHAVKRSALAIVYSDVQFFKRAIDLGASLGLLIGLAPVWLMTAVLIKLDSRGPVVYRQKRVGHQGRIFEVYKFRSMIVEAEADGPQYARVNDHRITRIGHFIRKTRIDEIPQIINVLRGEMSFVGPRPERPEFVEKLELAIPHYHARHFVKPGITGWAQVKYEYAASVEGAREKLRYDLYYIRHFTPLMDILILFLTIRVVLFGIGSR